jgi:hypothetical protein
MTPNDETVRVRLDRWILCMVALLSAAAGSLVTAQVTRAAGATADSDRVFELDIYHVTPGKVRALEARFRDAAKLQAKHGLNVIGYWVPRGDPAWDNTFVYLLAHSSRAQADQQWDAFHADPEFKKFLDAERAEPLIERVDTVYMRATDYSRTQ